MAIQRPQGRSGAVSRVRVEDSDQNGAAFTFVTNQRTRVRAPEPAYRTPNDAFENNAPASGRAKAAAGIR